MIGSAKQLAIIFKPSFICVITITQELPKVFDKQQIRRKNILCIYQEGNIN